MPFRLLLSGLLAGLALSVAAQAQTPPPPTLSPLPPPAAGAAADSSLRCGSYAFLSFLIYDVESGPEPVVAEGVGGTLTLLPDGRFEQRLRLGLPPKTTTFERTGRYQLLGGGQLRFSYLIAQGKPRTDIGTYRYDPAHGGLVVRIEGFPAGSYSVYTLVATDAASAPTDGQ